MLFWSDLLWSLSLLTFGELFLEFKREGKYLVRREYTTGRARQITARWISMVDQIITSALSTT